MDCTVSDVMSSSMSMLGDPGAEITQELFDDFSVAHSELINALLKVGAPEVERELFYTLSANTNTLFPSTLGVIDFAEPRQIYERGSVATDTIMSIVDGTPMTVTVASGQNPAAPDNRVELSGVPNVPPWVNRDWFITAVSPGVFTLNGSISTGVGGTIATSGTVAWSADQWKKVELVDASPTYDTETPTLDLCYWRWDGRVIYFPRASNAVRQLWIQYTADSTPPPTGTIGLLDGREKTFLATATAAHFAPKRQLPMGPQLASWAYGPSGEPDGTGGHLRELLLPLIKQKNALPRRSGKFRIRRGVVIAV